MAAQLGQIVINPEGILESLAGIAAFVSAAEHRSYVAAGRVLGASSSAIAKSISRLETRLGVRLLNRTTRSIRWPPLTANAPVATPAASPRKRNRGAGRCCV